MAELSFDRQQTISNDDNCSSSANLTLKSSAHHIILVLAIFEFLSMFYEMVDSIILKVRVLVLIVSVL